jgi:hypothetical protein
MQRAYVWLVVTLVAAGALSCVVGLLFTQIIARVPCRNRRALAGATIGLLAPLVVFFFISSIESWRYVGLNGYSEWRKFLVTFMPPILAVLVQSLVLRVVTGPGRNLPDPPRSPVAQFPEK